MNDERVKLSCESKRRCRALSNGLVDHFLRAAFLCPCSLFLLKRQFVSVEEPDVSWTDYLQVQLVVSSMLFPTLLALSRLSSLIVITIVQIKARYAVLSIAAMVHFRVMDRGICG